MAIETRNYLVGESYSVEKLSIGQVENTTDKNFIRRDGVLVNGFNSLLLYISDGASGYTALPSGAYDAQSTLDEGWTTMESEDNDGTGASIYSQWRLIDDSYIDTDLYVDFTDWGTYSDNDALYQVANRLGEMADFPFSVTDSDLQDLFSSYGKYAVYCNGATIDKSTNPMYENLVDMLKTEANGDTAHPFYAADDNQATLPDARGRVMRAIDSSGLIDPDGATRDLGSLQEDAMQRITGNLVGIAGDGNNDGDGVFDGVSSETGTYSSGATRQDVTIPFDSANSTSPNTAKTNDTETRMANLAVNKIIFYV